MTNYSTKVAYENLKTELIVEVDKIVDFLILSEGDRNWCKKYFYYAVR